MLLVNEWGGGGRGEEREGESGEKASGCAVRIPLAICTHLYPFFRSEFSLLGMLTGA